MKCRSCGMEIADKAIVCFRCGTPTMVAPPSAPRPRSRPRWIAVPIMLVIVGLAAWLVPLTPAGSASRWLAWTVVGVVSAGVVVWLRGR